MAEERSASFSSTKLELSDGSKKPDSKVDNDPHQTSKFFSSKEDVGRLVDELQRNLTTGEDGQLRGLWILTLVDHWNNDHEKVVVLLDRTIYVVKYDFVTQRLRDTKRIPLNTLMTVQCGAVVYPPKSLMPARNCRGVRLIWGDLEQVSMTQKWNPLCSNLPYVTLINHPLLGKLPPAPPNAVAPATGGTGADPRRIYDVEAFYATLKETIAGTGTELSNNDVVVESYGNLTSFVFNQSNLGFCKDRNGVSF